MDSVEDYARQWAKREKVEVVILSELVKTVKSLIQIRINNIQGSVCTKAPSVLKYTAVLGDLSAIYDKFVVVPVDKASNNIVLVCKNTTLIA